MHKHSRVYSKDEELGKRDDDFRPKRTSSIKNGFNALRWCNRRVALVLAVIVLVYVFVHNIPTDLGPIDQRLGRPLRPGHSVEQIAREEPTGAPPRPAADEDRDERSKHYYDGPIKFYKLASSLHGITRTMGSRLMNRNILFAASSIKSVANLIPMACEMAKWDRNYVHLALFGRDSLSLDDVLEINGVDKEECAVYWHDARGDYSEYSTDARLEVSVAGAMKHINDFMHPQAVVTDDSSMEDQPFTRAVRRKGTEYDHAVIEIPAGKYVDFLWITRLDSSSLASWFKPSIDIIVHAPERSSGGLTRLIKSLQAGDYDGLRTPRLTIELPTAIESFARDYLKNLRWPPVSHPSPIEPSTLTLRHRIPPQHLSSEQASVRFVEDFYPSVPEDTHVLVLSPQVELSPLYLQYLHYAVLEYRYSSYGLPSSQDLLGISLDVPSTFLNGSAEFMVPTVADMNAHKYTDDEALDKASASPFLYQAPSATASLIFGDKWATFHDFLSNRLLVSHIGKAQKTKKVVSETEPAWTEYLLELIRARGWNTLHPATPFATIHNELAQLPEEYAREQVVSQKGAEVLKQSDHPEEEPFLTAAEAPVNQQHIEKDPVEGRMPLHGSLPFHGDLPELPHLPFVSYTGKLNSLTILEQMRENYVPIFRKQIGACDAAEAKRVRKTHALKTDDLFCMPGVEVEYDLEAEDEEAEAAEVIANSSAHAMDPPETEAEDDDQAAFDGGEAADTAEPGLEQATVETEEEVSGQDSEVPVD